MSLPVISVLPVWACLAGSSLGFAAGSVFLKRFADLGGIGDLGISFLIFAASNLLYAQVLARGLGQGAVLSSMAQIIVLSALGAVLFKEHLGHPQLAGMVMAAGGVWLYSVPG